MASEGARRSGVARAGDAKDLPTPALVIFDCDGVLIDSEMISAAVLVEIAAEAGVAFDAPYVRENFLGRSFPTVAQVIRERFAVALPPDFEARYRARLLARFEGELRPTPGLLPLLDRLRVPACVATSSSPPRAARSLAIAGLEARFPRVFTASEVARGKPAPDLFLHAARAMGVAPGRCLVIEDSRPGLLAAQAAGMAALLYTGASHLRGLGPGALADLGVGPRDGPRDGPEGFDRPAPLRAFGDWADLPTLVPGLFGPGPVGPSQGPAPGPRATGAGA